MDKSEIQAIFKLIKLSADFDHTAYVLAFDETMVSSALAEKYSANSNADAGLSFLEKIVQVPLHLPPADQISLRACCFDGINQALQLADISVPDDDAQVFMRHFVDGLEIRLGTPRMAKRYANALSFALPILKGEVNIVDLMLVEGVRAFYPSLYRCIRDNPDTFLSFADTPYTNAEESKKKRQAVINEALSCYSDKEQERARHLVKTLFLQTSVVFGGSNYGSDWSKQWAEKKQISSREYFQRYFSYAIPEGDVPDTEVELFISTLTQKDVATNVNLLKKLVTNRNADKCIGKLRQFEKRLDPGQASALALAMSFAGELFPDVKAFFSFNSPLTQASILVSQSLQRIPQRRSRVATAKKIAKTATPLSFAVECFRWMRHTTKHAKSDNVLTEADTRVVGKELAARISAEAKGQFLWEAYGDRAPQLLWIWSKRGKKQDVTRYIERAISTDPRNVLPYLKSYLPTSWGLESGLSGKGSFERSQYDSVCDLINPKKIYDALKKLGVKGISSASVSEYYDDEALDERVALEFAALHHHVLKETRAKKTSTKKRKAKAPAKAGKPKKKST